MACYIPSIGQKPDGRCDCGRPATNEWDYHAHRYGWIKTLIACYQMEHHWRADIDLEATREMLRECEAIYAELIAALGERPPTPEFPDDHEMPL